MKGNQGRLAGGVVSRPGLGRGSGQEKGIYSFIQQRFIYIHFLPSPVLAGIGDARVTKTAQAPTLMGLTVNK